MNSCYWSLVFFMAEVSRPPISSRSGCHKFFGIFQRVLISLTSYFCKLWCNNLIIANASVQISVTFSSFSSLHFAPPLLSFSAPVCGFHLFANFVHWQNVHIIGLQHSGWTALHQKTNRYANVYDDQGLSNKFKSSISFYSFSRAS